MNFRSLLSGSLLCFLLIFDVAAQRSFQAGFLPSINFNSSLSNDLSINTKAEARQVFYEKNDLVSDYQLTDISLVISKKVGLSNALAGGYLLRIRDGELISRLIQQFTNIQKVGALRLSHRFVFDQTLQKNEETQFRLRYRLSTQMSLRGQSVDPSEFYLKLGNEYLNILQGDDYDLEIRLKAMLGYVFSDDSKVEVGLESRMDSFLQSSLRHRSWLNAAWYIAI